MSFSDRFKEEREGHEGFVFTSKGNVKPISHGSVNLDYEEDIVSNSKDWAAGFINQLMLDGKLSKNQVRDLHGYPHYQSTDPTSPPIKFDYLNKTKEDIERAVDSEKPSYILNGFSFTQPGYQAKLVYNVEKHKDICAELTDVYAKKNADYGDSFSDSLDKRGIVAALVRMEDKTNRLDSVTKSGEKLVDDETLVDTVMDLANYAIMTAMWLDSKLEFDEKK